LSIAPAAGAWRRPPPQREPELPAPKIRRHSSGNCWHFLAMDADKHGCELMSAFACVLLPSRHPARSGLPSRRRSASAAHVSHIVSPPFGVSRRPCSALSRRCWGAGVSKLHGYGSVWGRHNCDQGGEVDHESSRALLCGADNRGTR
jgi:hypothetical protein